MDTRDWLASGLDAFAAQFRAQADSAGLPGSEHAVHFALALGLQAAWALPPGTIVFECPTGNGSRIDLWVREPRDLVIEVKYLRSHSSGSTPARPMHYGQLLADFNKVAQVRAGLRLVVLAADDGYVTYIERSGRSILPLRTSESTSIPESALSLLADTPRHQANSHGRWQHLQATLRWSAKPAGCSLRAWEVTPRPQPFRNANGQQA